MAQTRKEFLKNLGIITIGACCGATMLSVNGCASVKSVNGTFENKRITINKSDFADGKSLQVKHMDLKAPVFISKINEGEYIAVQMLCTHKDCELISSGVVLHCPCHGSEFSTSGKVLEGPAEADLLKYNVTTEGDKIIIHL